VEENGHVSRSLEEWEDFAGLYKYSCLYRQLVERCESRERESVSEQLNEKKFSTPKLCVGDRRHLLLTLSASFRFPVAVSSPWSPFSLFSHRRLLLFFGIAATAYGSIH
jgi:hypothetical protein